MQYSQINLLMQPELYGLVSNAGLAEPDMRRESDKAVYVRFNHFPWDRESEDAGKLVQLLKGAMHDPNKNFIFVRFGDDFGDIETFRSDGASILDGMMAMGHEVSLSDEFASVHTPDDDVDPYEIPEVKNGQVTETEENTSGSVSSDFDENMDEEILDESSSEDDFVEAVDDESETSTSDDFAENESEDDFVEAVNESKDDFVEAVNESEDDFVEAVEAVETAETDAVDDEVSSTGADNDFVSADETEVEDVVEDTTAQDTETSEHKTDCIVRFKKIERNAHTPTHGSDGAAGYDLYSTNEVPVPIPAGKTAKFGTGIAVEIPDGYFGAVYARSGLATKNGLRPANCVGVVDSDYRGEIAVFLHNDSAETQTIHPGTRIAQLVIQPHMYVDFTEVDDLDDTKRGEGGFGSTGTN